MSGAIYTTGDEVERRASVYMGPVRSQLRENDWTGPPFNVWSHFQVGISSILTNRRLYMQVLQFDSTSWLGLPLPSPCVIAVTRWILLNVNLLVAVAEMGGPGSLSSSQGRLEATKRSTAKSLSA